ncbi:alginate lyase family protein [Roseateles sp.]|uniref:alginate lyase family protein n=1 Tax=Roseateles sp. TaxID=1971397 RepID=UPI0025D656DA|nr:alginate lyase family protein [Roseateles sp.]MBV8036569.1 alginate lyase family protein [Roseateles sp.]
MTVRRRSLLLGLLGLSMSQVQAASGATPQLLTLDGPALDEARRRLAAGDTGLAAAHQALRTRAARALKAPLRSVVDKTLAPPSGSRNDYLSMGPYWWPNPATPNGLPYIRRDGQRNPQVAGEALDADRLQAFCRDVFDLTLAHLFGAPVGHAEKAVAALRHWFLAPATRMRPHLRYAQGIPGIVEGRAEGLIDTRNLWMAIDAALLLNASGALPDGDLAALREWFAEFVQWMQTSAIGRDEDAADNNHGMFFDAQLVNYLLFTGQTGKAADRLATVQARRFAPQIEDDGRMPRELARTRPFHYCAFNLEAATRLAQYGRANGADLWRDPKLLRAIAFLQAAALSPERWRHATPTEPAPDADKLLPILLMTRFATGADQPLLGTLSTSSAAAVDWLLWNAPGA